MAWRAAVIGCGRMGSLFADQASPLGIYSHAQAYAICPQTQLVGVCDIDPGLARSCGARWETQAFSDPAELLDKTKPQIISICTPDETHYDLALMALDAQDVRALFMEKPLAILLDQANEVLERAVEKDVIIAVNYMRRYAPGFQEAARLVADGALGELITMSGFYTKGVMHNGTHWFDLARWLAGDVRQVQAWNPLHDKADDPCLDVAVDFRNGLRGYLHAARADAYSVFELDLLGTKGRLRLVDADMQFERFKVDDSPWYQGYKVLKPNSTLPAMLGDVVLKAAEDLVRCLDNGGAPLCTGHDALKALAIAERALESLSCKSPPAAPA